MLRASDMPPVGRHSGHPAESVRADLAPCAGGAVYSPAITDFIYMVNQTSKMFITGPQVIKTVTQEVVDAETLGGAVTHNETSGVAHFIADNDEQCLEQIRYLLGFLPNNNQEQPPVYAAEGAYHRTADLHPRPEG